MNEIPPTEGHNPYAPPGRSGAYAPATTTSREFRPAGALGLLTWSVLWAYVMLAAISGVLSVVGLLGHMEMWWRIAAISGLEILGVLVMVPLFCGWLYRVYANLVPLGREKNDFSNWWAPASFFAPIVNAIYPYEIAKECWVHSERALPKERGTDDTSLEHIPAPPKRSSARLVVAWWFFCMAWFTLVLILTIARKYIDADSATYYGLSLSMDIATLLAALCAAFMVRGINHRQLARHRALVPTAPKPEKDRPYG